MKTLFFDCSHGAAGDMLTAALLELVPDPEASIARINGLGLPGVEVRAKRDARGGIAGLLVDVLVNGEEEVQDDCHHHDHHHHHDDHHHEHAHHHDHVHHHHEHDDEHHHEHHHHEHHHATLDEIRSIIATLNVSEGVKDSARQVYDCLAAAESKAHGRPIEQVHFHEVGALDALADVVAVSLLIDEIAPDRILSTPLNAGGGTVRCAHGILPVPAPATANILLGIPWHGDHESVGELLTPTGAALLRHFVDDFVPMPVLSVKKIGYGLGHRDTPGAANLVRALLAEDYLSESGPNSEIVKLECNIDDMTGEDLAFALSRIMAAGAVDVSTSAIMMKKGRPGLLLTALCHADVADAVAISILRETTTFGVRRMDCLRYELDRTIIESEGQRTKLGRGYGIEKSKVEFEDRARIANDNGLPICN